jgi:hypothetical protein
VRGAAGGYTLALASAVLCAASSGCARDEDKDKPRQVDLAPGFARIAAAAPEGGVRASAGTPAPAKDPPWPRDVDSAAPSTLQYVITRTVVIDAGSRPLPLNPDDAILEKARVAAGNCYAALPAAARYGAPERSAHIVLTVIPSGTVSSANVTSGDTTDDGVLGCIRQTALSTAFSDNSGGPLRTYAIDVRVIADGSRGGR